MQEKALYGTLAEFVKTKHEKLDEDMWRAIFFQVREAHLNSPHSISTAVYRLRTISMLPRYYINRYTLYCRRSLYICEVGLSTATYNSTSTSHGSCTLPPAQTVDNIC